MSFMSGHFFLLLTLATAHGALRSNTLPRIGSPAIPLSRSMVVSTVGLHKHGSEEVPSLNLFVALGRHPGGSLQCHQEAIWDMRRQNPRIELGWVDPFPTRRPQGEPTTASHQSIHQKDEDASGEFSRPILHDLHHRT